MKIIDFHTHVFHPKVAHLAIEKLENHYCYKWQCSGTLEDLINNTEEVYRSVVFATPTKPGQTIINNDYLLSIKNEKLIVFGSLHPEFEDVDGEIKRVKVSKAQMKEDENRLQNTQKTPIFINGKKWWHSKHYRAMQAISPAPK